MAFDLGAVLSTCRCLILDGPTGTELIRRGFAPDPVLWTGRASEEAPGLLRAVHRDYLAAGAQILTANTFRTGAYSLAQAGLPVSDRLTRATVAAARQALADAGAAGWVAGSLAPLEDCYAPGRVPPLSVLERAHEQTAAWLVDAGCDLILVETMGTTVEAVAAVRAAKAAGAGTVLVSFITDPGGAALLGGEPLLGAARAGAAAGAAGVLVNCVHADTLERALEVLQPLAAEGVVLGGYANAARMEIVAGEVRWQEDTLPVVEQARRDAACALRWVEELGVRIVGSCCGTTPEYIRCLAEALRAGSTRQDQQA